MSSALVQVLRCECTPNKVYPNASLLHQHYKTKRHLAWEDAKRVDYLEKKITQMQITITNLQVECEVWKTEALRMRHKKID